MTDQTEMPERIWAKVKTFSRFYGVNRETEERREWCESYATPEIAYICGAVEYTRADISDAKDERIEELEQLVATLEANLADADALTSAAFTDGASNNVRLAETSHRIEELEAERDNWRKVAIDSLAMKEGSDTRAEAAEQRIEELEDKLAKFMV